MNKIVIDDYTSEQLRLARETYGNNNQILVCMEELNELACVLAKYPRYADESKATEELHDKVLDEMADVFIVLNHVKSIFGITSEELNERSYKKVERLSRWLSHSNSMQETVDDRKVEDPGSTAVDNGLCEGCVRRQGTITGEEYVNACLPCYKAQATEGIAPYYQNHK